MFAELTERECRNAIALEYDKAAREYPPFASLHEGWAVMREEWEEAFRELSAAAYENTGLEPWEIGRAIEKAAKDAESATAAKMAECIAGGIKDTVEAIHRDFDGFFKRG